MISYTGLSVSQKTYFFLPTREISRMAGYIERRYINIFNNYHEYHLKNYGVSRGGCYPLRALANQKRRNIVNE